MRAVAAESVRQPRGRDLPRIIEHPIRANAVQAEVRDRVTSLIFEDAFVRNRVKSDDRSRGYGVYGLRVSIRQ